MKLEEFLIYRQKELQDFFKARFGRSWRRRVASGLGMAHAPGWVVRVARPGNVCPWSRRRFHRVEDFAVSAGFRAKPPFYFLPFERNSFPRFESLVTHLTYAGFGSVAPECLNARFALIVSQHKCHSSVVHSDVISPEFIETQYPSQRIASPMAESAAPGLQVQGLDDLLDRHILPGPTPNRQPPPPGEIGPPTHPLSGPGAAKKVPRVELVPPAQPGPTARLNVIRGLLEELENDHDIPLDKRLEYLAKVARGIEGTLLRHDLEEKLADDRLG